jgi:Na+/H+ antiporter NhaA
MMAFFFVLVTTEIKRELVAGELSSFKKAILPLGAAVWGDDGSGSYVYRLQFAYRLFTWMGDSYGNRYRLFVGRGFASWEELSG